MFLSQSEPRPDAEILEVDHLRLVEVTAPLLSTSERNAMNEIWDKLTEANPHFFDGPVAVCAGLKWDGPRDLTVTWARTTYRFYALRKVPGAVSLLPSMFVTVAQPTSDGHLLIGRTSSSTASPGRWELPRGSIEPSAAGETLDVAALRRHAARELIEEIGLEIEPAKLTLWNVTRGRKGNIGVHFLAPPQQESLLRERYAALASVESARGRCLELDQITFVGSNADLVDLGAPLVDYLKPIINRHRV